MITIEGNDHFTHWRDYVRQWHPAFLLFATLPEAHAAVQCLLAEGWHRADLYLLLLDEPPAPDQPPPSEDNDTQDTR